MHKLAEIAARNMDHYRKVQRHINMLTTELSGLSCESIDGDDLEVEIDGDDLEVETDQVHTPLKVRSKGRLPYKRKESAVEKAINKKKSQEKRNESRQRKVAYFSSPSA
jgi:hypothetical protein